MRIYRIQKKEQNRVGQFLRGWILTALSIADFGIYEGGTRVWKLGGEDYIKVKFSVAEPLYLRVGDFVQYDGQVFILTQAYTPNYNESTGGYDYEVQFEAYYKVLMNRTFMLSYTDAKKSPIPQRVESSWKYTADLEGFVEILENNCFADEMIYPVGEPEEIQSGDAAPHTFKFQAYPLRFGFYGNIDTPSPHNINSEGSGHENDFAIHSEMEEKVEFTCDAHKYIEFDGVTMQDAINTLCSEENFDCECWFDTYNAMVVFGRVGGKVSFEESEGIRGVTIATPTGDKRCDKEALSLSVSGSEKEYFNRLRLYGSSNNIPETFNKKIILVWNNNTSWFFDDMKGDTFRSDVTMYSGEGMASWEYHPFVDTILQDNITNVGKSGYLADMVWSLKQDIPSDDVLQNGSKFVKLKMVLDGEVEGNAENITAEVNVLYQYLDKDGKQYEDLKSAISSPRYINHTTQEIELDTLAKNFEAFTLRLYVTARYYSARVPYDYEEYKIPKGVHGRIYAEFNFAKSNCITKEIKLIGYDKELQETGEEVTIRICGSTETTQKKSIVSIIPSQYIPQGTYWCPENALESDEWPVYLYSMVGDFARYGNSIKDRRLPMMDAEGNIVPYVDADGADNIFAETIVEKVEVDEKFYPKVTMANTMTTELDKDNPDSAITLYEYKHGELRKPGTKEDAWSLTEEYNDGSQNIKYYDYYLLNDNLTDILTKKDGENYGISEDWLIAGAGSMKVHFNSGKLAGMEFEVHIEERKVKSEGKLLSVFPNEDYGQVLPNATLHPEKGDEYVIIGWNPIYMESGTSVIKAAGYRLYQTAREIVNDATREHNTYTLKTMADSIAQKVNAALYDKYNEPINDKYGDPIRTNDSGYDVSILPVGTYVRISDKGCFKEERMGIRNCSELLRIVGIEHPLDIPYDSLTYTIGETPVLKGKLNSLTKAIKRI